MGRLPRFRLLLTALCTLTFVFAGSSPAYAWTTTRQTSSYYVKAPFGGVKFYAAEKLWYTLYSDRIDVDWSDLYINVMDQPTSNDAKTLYCGPSYWQRYTPVPYTGYQLDDDSPASFNYYNTPAWAEVDFRSFPDFRWNSGTYPVQFDNRAFGRNYPQSTYCTNGFYFAGMAGAAVYYLPSTGFYEFERDPGGV